MPSAINPTTNAINTPYLTVKEFKNAPTGIDIDNLIYNNINPYDQDSELANVIGRASSWIDTYCNQVLGATTETETQRTRVTGAGTLSFHPRYSPIVALTELQYGSDPNNLVVVSDPSTAWLENSQVIFPYGAYYTNMTSQGPIQFGYPATQGTLTYIKYTYVAGYANTLINTATAGQASLTVTEATGITAGMQLKIYDDMHTEKVTVASNYTFGSTTIPLTNNLLFSHDPGISISALPPAIKEAAILVTTSFLKVRGDNSLVMGVGTQPSQIVPGSQNIGTELAMAMELLKPYRRIR